MKKITLYNLSYAKKSNMQCCCLVTSGHSPYLRKQQKCSHEPHEMIAQLLLFSNFSNKKIQFFSRIFENFFLFYYDSQCAFSFLLPFNQYQYNDGIFTDPIYVTPNGTVVNTTIQSRIDTYYLNINISCNYYDSSINKYSNFGMIYTNYSNGYISCGSTHLTDFVLTQNYQPPNFTVSGPYFYLKYVSLVVNSVNLNYKIV